MLPSATSRKTVLNMCRELTPFVAGKKLGVSQLAAVCFGAGVGKTFPATVRKIEKALSRKSVKGARKASRKAKKA
jgi:hypothetical protein